MQHRNRHSEADTNSSSSGGQTLILVDSWPSVASFVTQEEAEILRRWMLIEGKAKRLLGSEAVDKVDDEDRNFPQAKALAKLREVCKAEYDAMALTSQREARDLTEKLNKIGWEKNYGRRAYGKSR